MYVLYECVDVCVFESLYLQGMNIKLLKYYHWFYARVGVLMCNVMYGGWMNLAALVTHMLLSPMIAHFAFNVAAPNESALALLLDVSYSRLVATAAAQQSASVDTM